MTANSLSQGGDAGKVLFGLVCVVAIAWIYLLAGAGVDSYAALVFAMWAIMMVPMMLPSAAAPRS